MPSGSRRCLPFTGYTLIELIMVIVILGVAASLLIPEMTNRDRLAVQAAIRAVIGDLGYAASDAQANQEFRRVYFFADGRGYCLMRITGTDPASWDTPADIENCPGPAATPCSADIVIDRFRGNQPYVVEFTRQSRLNGVTIGDVNVDNALREVTFDSLGGTVYHDGTAVVPGLGGYIEIQFGDDLYRVSISPFTGKLTVAKCPPGGCL